MLVVLLVFFRWPERRCAWQFLLRPLLAALLRLSRFHLGARVPGRKCRFLEPLWNSSACRVVSCLLWCVMRCCFFGTPAFISIPRLHENVVFAMFTWLSDSSRWVFKTTLLSVRGNYGNWINLWSMFFASIMRMQTSKVLPTTSWINTLRSPSPFCPIRMQSPSQSVR